LCDAIAPLFLQAVFLNFHTANFAKVNVPANSLAMALVWKVAVPPTAFAGN